MKFSMELTATRQMPRGAFDADLKNYILYISPMYEF